MEFILLTVGQVVKLHDSVINPGELQGLAGSKSLDGALSRVEFRILYGVINDIFDLAATYAVVLAQGHVFNDANKRTAYQAMEMCLHLHGEHIEFDTKEVGDVIIKVAQGHMDEGELATWLRQKHIEALEKKVEGMG